MRARALVCAVVIALAGAIHLLAGRWLAGRDVVLALIAGERGPALVAVVALLAARLFLFLLAPGWALYVLALIAAARYQRPRP